MEDFQEADVLWPWPDTPPPSPEEEGRSYTYAYHHVPAAAAAPELYEYGDDASIDFSCEPFSVEPAAAASSWSWPWSSTSSSTLSALLLSSESDDDGRFFLSGTSTVPAGLVIDADATEEFLEADVLWPDDTAADEEAGFLWRRRRIEEAAASSAVAAVFCGKREGCSSRPLVAATSSSPIDIPMATTGATAARRRRP